MQTSCWLLSLMLLLLLLLLLWLQLVVDLTSLNQIRNRLIGISESWSARVRIHMKSFLSFEIFLNNPHCNDFLPTSYSIIITTLVVTVQRLSLSLSLFKIQHTIMSRNTNDENHHNTHCVRQLQKLIKEVF